MGKVLAETRGDVQEAIDEAYYVAGEGRRLFGKTTPSELQNKFAMSVRMPVGVVGLITPWNFPMAIPSWKLFPALVGGNTCVIKPATDTPLSVYNLVQALVDAGLPAGRHQYCLRRRRIRRQRPRRASRRARHQLHRLQRSGLARSAARGGQLQARFARNGRQERPDCPRRRQPRTGARWRAVGRIRHHRPALHRDQPHPAAEGHRRRVHRKAGGARQEAEDRQRPRRIRAGGPAGERQRRSKLRTNYVEIAQERRRKAPLRRSSRSPRAHSARAHSSSRPSSAA